MNIITSIYSSPIAWPLVIIPILSLLIWVATVIKTWGSKTFDWGKAPTYLRDHVLEWFVLLALAVTSTILASAPPTLDTGTAALINASNALVLLTYWGGVIAVIGKDIAKLVALAPSSSTSLGANMAVDTGHQVPPVEGTDVPGEAAPGEPEEEIAPPPKPTQLPAPKPKP